MNLMNEISDIKEKIKEKQYINERQIHGIVKYLDDFFNQNGDRNREECLEIYNMFIFINRLKFKIRMHDAFLNNMLLVPFQEGFKNLKTNNIPDNEIDGIKLSIQKRDTLTNKYLFGDYGSDCQDYGEYLQGTAKVFNKYNSMPLFYADVTIKDGYYYSETEKDILKIVCWDLSHKRERLQTSYFSEVLHETLVDTLVSYRGNDDFKYANEKFDLLLNEIRKFFECKNDTQLIHEDIFYTAILITEDIEVEIYRTHITKANSEQLNRLHNLFREILIGDKTYE